MAYTMVKCVECGKEIRWADAMRAKGKSPLCDSCYKEIEGWNSLKVKLKASIACPRCGYAQSKAQSDRGTIDDGSENTLYYYSFDCRTCNRSFVIYETVKKEVLK